MVLAALLFIARVSDTTTVELVTERYVEQSRVHILQDKDIPDYVAIYRVHGPFLFGTTDKIDKIVADIPKLPPIVVLRLRNMTALDATGLMAIEDLAMKLHDSGRHLLVCGARRQPAQVIDQSDFRLGGRRARTSCRTCSAAMDAGAGDLREGDPPELGPRRAPHGRELTARQLALRRLRGVARRAGRRHLPRSARLPARLRLRQRGLRRRLPVRADRVERPAQRLHQVDHLRRRLLGRRHDFLPGDLRVDDAAQLGLVVVAVDVEVERALEGLDHLPGELRLLGLDRLGQRGRVRRSRSSRGSRPPAAACTSRARARAAARPPGTRARRARACRCRPCPPCRRASPRRPRPATSPSGAR